MPEEGFGVPPAAKQRRMDRCRGPAGSTMARASSGSRSSISSIEPLISANNAVTVLRSPSIVVEASGCSGVTRIWGAVDAA